MKFQKENQGITLLALVITIIVLIILAGITINLVLGQNGILNRGKEAKETYAEQQAREKLELELANLYAEKELNSQYNENEYLTRKLEEKGFIVNENIVFVDDWQFEIDRSIPQIGESLGKGNKNEEIKLNISQVVSTDYVKSTIKAEIEYSKEIEYVRIAGEKKEGLSKGQDGKYSIEKDVTENGTYSVYVKDTEGNYNIGSIKVEELADNMIINSLEDFIQFRNNVNKGRTYEGKTVTLNSDIDLGSVCGAEIGSWEPIGTYINEAGDGIDFSGTFDGNYHIISNLYINSNEYQNLGLFTNLNKNAVVENFILSDVNIDNAYSQKTVSQTGGIAGHNSGLISNCGIDSGTITAITKLVGTDDSNRVSIYIGGIVGTSDGQILSCYNKASISGTSAIQTNWENFVTEGGIVGSASGTLTDCYNEGNTSANGGTVLSGGIAGMANKTTTSDLILNNSYNTGKVIGSCGTGTSGIYLGGVIGRNGYSDSCFAISWSNSYYLENTAIYSDYYYSSGMKTRTIGKITSNQLKTYASILGDAYTNDIQNNDGYPILKWQLNVLVSE